TFTNPHASYSANTTLYFYDNNGQPLSLDVGSGPVSQVQFTLGPQATATLVSSGASSTTVTGWALAVSTMPLQSVALFKYSTNGVAQQGVSVPAIPAAEVYSSPATTTSGIALVNPSSSAFTISITALDQNGKTLQGVNVPLGSGCHASFNVSQIL